MTLIYRAVVQEGYEWALPMSDDDFSKMRSLALQSDLADWQPISMSLLKELENGRPRRRAAMPWCMASLLILRDEAIVSVGNLLESYGLLLPLVCDEAELVAFQPTVKLAALDEERSTIVRFSSGRIMEIEQPVFHGEVAVEADVFVLPQLPLGPIYFSERIVSQIVGTGCASGTSFEVVNG